MRKVVKLPFFDAPPAQSSILDNQGSGEPYLVAEVDSGQDLACSNCGTILCVGVERSRIRNLLFRCKCGKYCASGAV